MKKKWIKILIAAAVFIVIALSLGLGLGLGLRKEPEVPPVAPPSGTDVGNSDIDYDDFFGSEDEELPTTPETPNETPEDDKTPEEIEKPTEPELPDDSNELEVPETPENDYTEFYTAAESEMEKFAEMLATFGEFETEKTNNENEVTFTMKFSEEVINEDFAVFMEEMSMEWETLEFEVAYSLINTYELIMTYTI